MKKKRDATYFTPERVEERMVIMLNTKVLPADVDGVVRRILELEEALDQYIPENSTITTATLRVFQTNKTTNEPKEELKP